MFYSQFILAKKGPLGTIWIAAHLERKLRKNQVADTDIGVSVDSILFPEVPIALRLSSHLLLGVVRIYSKKVNYLFDDCSDALLKVKQAFRSTAVDLPPEQSKAPYHSITLPETFDLDDFELPDNEVFQGNFVDHHVSTREQITLRDTMDGVAFPTSQFGPDERFGDGDASLIGLDLDEELLMDKGDAAGTSGISVDNGPGPETFPGGSSPFKGDGHNEGIPDPPLASSTNYFAIQAPSTPGLTEEPNLPSAKEEIQVSDDHMDEDQNLSEFAAKGVFGTNSVTAGPSDFDGSKLHLNENSHYMDKQDNVVVKALETESSEVISSGFAEPAISSEHVEATNGQDSMGKIFNSSTLENGGIVAVDMQSKDCCDVKEVNMNGTVPPVAENAIVMEVEDVGLNKTDLNGNFHSLESGAENYKLSAAPAVVGPVDALTSGSEHQNSFQSCVNLNTDETSESNIDGKSSGSGTPFLQVCTSKVPSACDAADNVLDAPNLPAQEDVRSSIGMSGKEDATNVSEISTNFQDEVEPTSQADQTAYGVTCAADSNLEGQLDNLVTEENHSEKEKNLQSSCAANSNLGEQLDNLVTADSHSEKEKNLQSTCAVDSNLGGQLDNLVTADNHSEKEKNWQSSDFPPPEVLLSVPNVPTGLSDNFLIDTTPVKEALATNGDAIDENVISGRKRSFTESTLTVQSFNSVESSGGAQSKGTVEPVPDDNDLLSSILAGKRSTSFKMKPSPQVHDTAHAKRQRTAVRSVAHKRKVLVDDSTVLHGDTIRQQLTNTEDIRRVRKKAPCTNLEVWVLQKQFLEDDIFSEPVFTGIFPALSSEQFDLNGIRVIQDNGSKGASEADKAVKPMLDEETEGVGSLVPSTADTLVRQQLNEKTEAVGTLVPSIAADEELLEYGRSLLATTCEQESTMEECSIPPNDIDNVDNEVVKQLSHYDATKEKVGMEIDDERTTVNNEAVHSVAEPILSTDHVPQVACNLIEDTKVDSKISDLMMSTHIDASDQLLDQKCVTHCSKGDAFVVDDGGSSIQDQGVDIVVSKNFDLDVRSDGEHLLENREGVDTDIDQGVDGVSKEINMEKVGVDTDIAMGHFQDTCSLPIHDFGISDSMALEDRACPTSDHVVEDCQLNVFGNTNKDEPCITGLVHDDSCLTLNNVGEHVKLDSLYSEEAYVSSKITNLNEMEGLQHSEADPKIDMDATPVPTELIDKGNNAELGTDTIEHDTDFLNVDDDDVAEDYESDTPDHEERRILDNSGWSARTRAVANYLQALFEKESDQSKKVISLDSLLVGKSRKEASRMFFETLVLKTKDYVQAEQENVFCDIKIKPRGKLMKPGF